MVKFGRILKSLSGFYYIKDDSDNTVYQTRARGNFRQKGTKPIVGDFAEFSTAEQSEGYVLAIKERNNALVRPPIANIDQAVVVISAIVVWLPLITMFLAKLALALEVELNWS